jgi:hypothetical protein
MALDAAEGEQELRYAESRREPLWHLLASGMDLSAIPTSVEGSTESSATAVSDETINPSSPVQSPTKNSLIKRAASTQDQEEVASKNAESTEQPPRKKRSSRQKTQSVVATPDPSNSETQTTASQPPQEKKPTRRVGQRKPKRDPVGT